ncbi:MAG: hypothetical protein ACRECT_07135 [Thermoplasmata archaeon]
MRGRRAQVSAVATILGLLLVVTFIANYLTTTLPGQMSTNDLDHVIQVENQVGRLQALLEAASGANAVGKQFTQPVTLGGAGQPPFAPADGGTFGPSNGSTFALAVPIGNGVWTYTPPTVARSVYTPGAGCSLASGSPTSVTCTGAGILLWNLSEAGKTSITFTGSAATGTYNINIQDSGTSTTNLATITLSLGSGTLNVLVIGNYDSIPLRLTGTGTANIAIIGNYDNLTITDKTGTGSVYLTELGTDDTTWIPYEGGLSNFVGSITGTADSVSVTTTLANMNSNTVASVYFVGDSFPPTTCPNDDLAISDSVAGGSGPLPPVIYPRSTTVSYGDYNVTYNGTSSPITPTTTPPVFWTKYNPDPSNILASAAANCPYYTEGSTPLDLGESGGGFTVHLANTYLPPADIAFDSGGVVYAQTGGIPTMIDPPAITATTVLGQLTGLSIWFPVFIGTFPVVSGLSTTELSARLLSVDTIALTTTTATTFALGADVTLTIVSPFAAAWENFFTSTQPYSQYGATCVGLTTACAGPYTVGGPHGTVSLAIPTGSALASLNVQIATFTVSLV